MTKHSIISWILFCNAWYVEHCPVYVLPGRWGYDWLQKCNRDHCLLSQTFPSGAESLAGNGPNAKLKSCVEAGKHLKPVCDSCVKPSLLQWNESAALRTAWVRTAHCNLTDICLQQDRNGSIPIYNAHLSNSFLSVFSAIRTLNGAAEVWFHSVCLQQDETLFHRISWAWMIQLFCLKACRDLHSLYFSSNEKAVQQVVALSPSQVAKDRIFCNRSWLSSPSFSWLLPVIAGGRCAR